MTVCVDRCLDIYMPDQAGNVSDIAPPRRQSGHCKVSEVVELLNALRDILRKLLMLRFEQPLLFLAIKLRI